MSCFSSLFLWLAGVGKQSATAKTTINDTENVFQLGGQRCFAVKILFRCQVGCEPEFFNGILPKTDVTMQQQLEVEYSFRICTIY